jgi:hypothetical protein
MNDLFRLRLFTGGSRLPDEKHRFEYQGFDGSEFHVFSLAAKFGRLEKQHHLNWWCNLNRLCV